VKGDANFYCKFANMQFINRFIPFQFITILFFTCITLHVNAQEDKIELLQAGSLEGNQINHSVVLKHGVVFKQGAMRLYCDSAIQYGGRNYVEAYGHVRLIQGDTFSLTCRQLDFDGAQKIVKAKGDVLVRDKQTTIRTQQLDFNRTTGLAYYTTGATIMDNGTQLKSQYGMYNTKSKVFSFRNQVEVVNTNKGFKLISDTLDYNALNKIATYKGPTTITTKDGEVKSLEGAYNTAKAVMYFKGKAQVVSGENKITATQIDYDEKRKIGVATQNVSIENNKDSVLILGQRADYKSNPDFCMVSGKPLLIKASGKDTLFLKSDTLVYSNAKTKVVRALKQARFIRGEMSGICDSLVYNFSDSIIRLIGKPMLWYQTNQISADSVWVTFKNGKMYEMHFRQNAFMINKDTIGSFNQIKGRTMLAHFENNQLQYIRVDGNAECIYHALDDANQLMGMNKSTSGSIYITFNNGQLKKVNFINKPDAEFIPPHEITKKGNKLKGFKWLIKQKPIRGEFKI
jgi:lipopolysaccharide export system protein LptA